MSQTANLRVVCAFLSVYVPALASLNNSLNRPDQDYRSLPLVFEPNQGQSVMPAPFYIRDRDGLVYLQPGGLQFKLLYRDWEGSGVLVDTVALQFQGANKNATMEGRDILPGKSNYFIGNDPARWRTNVPQYERVHTESVYPGINADFYSVAGQLEYDFLVEPGADPSHLRLQFEGQESIELNNDGDLVLHSRGGDLIQRRPIGYQLSGGVRHPVWVHYRLLPDKSVDFELGAYDRRLPLVIDPSFVYSTRFGGTRQDEPARISVDSTGSAYITGLTYSLDFPTVNAVQGRLGDSYGLTPDVFISKLNPAGTQLVYSTYLGESKDDL